MGPLPSYRYNGVQKVLNGPGGVRESETAPLPGPPVEDGQEAGVAEGDPGGVQDEPGAAVVGRRGQQCPQRGGAEVVDLSGEAEDQGGAEGGAGVDDYDTGRGVRARVVHDGTSGGGESGGQYRCGA